MSTRDVQGAPVPVKRADARRNQQNLLDAAATVFARSGVDAPDREIATAAGVGMGTIYRHFPTRAELIIAVYRHQVDACAAAGPALLAAHPSPYAALVAWIDQFVDFLVTKHGLAAALQGDRARFDALHQYFLERLLPVFTEILDTAVRANEVHADVNPYGLLRGVGNLCAGADGDPRYETQRLVRLLVSGLARPHPATT